MSERSKKPIMPPETNQESEDEQLLSKNHPDSEAVFSLPGQCTPEIHAAADSADPVLVTNKRNVASASEKKCEEPSDIEPETKAGDIKDGKVSFFGPKYDEYYRKEYGTPFDEDKLPKVEVRVKILTLADVDIKSYTYFCDFVLMLDWIDESIPVGAKKIEWNHHFWPEVEVDNAIDVELIGGKSMPRRRAKKGLKAMSSNHVTFTQRYRAKLRCTYDLRRFPFDVQFLDLIFKVRTISTGAVWRAKNRSEKSNGCITLSDPKLRGDKGHCINKGADCMEEWLIGGIFGAPQHDRQHVETVPDKYIEPPDEYRVQIFIKRNCSNLVWNLGLTMCFVTVLSLTAFGLEAENFSGRVDINFTLVLTLMAFKYVLNDRLPRIPYMTPMDRYAICSFLLLVIQACYFTLSNWIFNNVDDGKSISDSFDDVMLAFSVMYLVLLHVYSWHQYKIMSKYHHRTVWHEIIDHETEDITNLRMDYPYTRENQEKIKKMIERKRTQSVMEISKRSSSWWRCW